MFHLLVSYSGWPDGGGTMLNSRIYINPNGPPGNMFCSHGVLDVSKINQYPALLVTEPGGTGGHFAKVAHITNITPGHKETAIQYAVDNSIAPISNTDLEKYPTELRLGSFAGIMGPDSLISVQAKTLSRRLGRASSKRSLVEKINFLHHRYEAWSQAMSVYQRKLAPGQVGAGRTA